MLQAQQKWQNQLSGFGMHQALLKSIGQHEALYRNNFANIDSIARSIAMQPKFNIPTTAFDAITAISKQHDQLFGSYRNIADMLQKQNAAFTKLNNLQFALSGISSQLATVAATQKKWSLLDDFQEITSEAVAINEKIIEEEGFTKESLSEIKSFLQRIELRVDKNDADANAIFWKFIALLGILLAIIGEVRNWIPKPEYATKQEVESVIKEQFSVMQEKLKEKKEFRITNRKTRVNLKPKRKTSLIEILPKGFDVIVMQVNHEWVYVSYTSPKDNLPQTGWVLKKYLNKPE